MAFVHLPASLLLCAALLLAACGHGLPPDDAPPPPDLTTALASGQAVQVLYGAPEGVDPLFPLGGIYTTAEASQPETRAAQGALGVAGVALADQVEAAADWRAAHAAVQAFLASPPEEAAPLPRYILEQLAAQTMAHYRPDLLQPGPDTDKRRASSLGSTPLAVCTQTVEAPAQTASSASSSSVG